MRPSPFTLRGGSRWRTILRDQRTCDRWIDALPSIHLLFALGLRILPNFAGFFRARSLIFFVINGFRTSHNP
jgi:hypothetical protein